MNVSRYASIARPPLLPLTLLTGLILADCNSAIPSPVWITPATSLSPLGSLALFIPRSPGSPKLAVSALPSGASTKLAASFLRNCSPMNMLFDSPNLVVFQIWPPFISGYLNPKNPGGATSSPATRMSLLVLVSNSLAPSYLPVENSRTLSDDLLTRTSSPLARSSSAKSLIFGAILVCVSFGNTISTSPIFSLTQNSGSLFVVLLPKNTPSCLAVNLSMILLAPLGSFNPSTLKRTSWGAFPFSFWNALAALTPASIRVFSFGVKSMTSFQILPSNAFSGATTPLSLKFSGLTLMSGLTPPSLTFLPVFVMIGLARLPTSKPTLVVFCGLPASQTLAPNPVSGGGVLFS